MAWCNQTLGRFLNQREPRPKMFFPNHTISDNNQEDAYGAQAMHFL